MTCPSVLHIDSRPLAQMLRDGSIGFSSTIRTIAVGGMQRRRLAPMEAGKLTNAGCSVYNDLQIFVVGR